MIAVKDPLWLMRDSNLRPTAYQAGALPTELINLNGITFFDCLLLYQLSYAPNRWSPMPKRPSRTRTDDPQICKIVCCNDPKLSEE